MKSIKTKNIKLQTKFSKIEKIRVLSKFIKTHVSGSILTRNFLPRLKELTFFRKFYYNKISRVRIKTRCIFTNRSNSITKKYGASRFILRHFIQFGFLPGYKKAVW